MNMKVMLTYSVARRTPVRAVWVCPRALLYFPFRCGLYLLKDI